MRFRPCIDIHNGKVKQIVGSSLRDDGDRASENFVAEKDAAWFAAFYRKDHLSGGHIILLNPESSPYYKETRAQALSALRAWPGGMQVGGGIRPDNAADFLDAGAAAVIVTSYVFENGKVNLERLRELSSQVGREHLVIDLSCRQKKSAGPCSAPEASACAQPYYIVTNRWQTFTDTPLNQETLQMFSQYCCEFLVHAVDAEGKQSGPDRQLVRLLAEYSPLPCTYAGGVGTYHDLDVLRTDGQGKIDVTIGSALDLFGGPLKYDEVLRYIQS